jgi:hypothetical protein
LGVIPGASFDKLRIDSREREARGGLCGRLGLLPLGSGAPAARASGMTVREGSLSGATSTESFSGKQSASRESRLCVARGMIASSRVDPTKVLGRGPRLTPWVKLASLRYVSGFVWGRACSVSGVCQSRGSPCPRIPNIAATWDTINANAHRAASSKSWLSGWLPNPRVCVRARVMAPIYGR